jgi:hypothetical protein
MGEFDWAGYHRQFDRPRYCEAEDCQYRPKHLVMWNDTPTQARWLCGHHLRGVLARDEDIKVVL